MLKYLIHAHCLATVYMHTHTHTHTRAHTHTHTLSWLFLDIHQTLWDILLISKLWCHCQWPCLHWSVSGWCILHAFPVKCSYIYLYIWVCIPDLVPSETSKLCQNPVSVLVGCFCVCIFVCDVKSCHLLHPPQELERYRRLAERRAKEAESNQYAA